MRFCADPLCSLRSSCNRCDFYPEVETFDPPAPDEGSEDDINFLRDLDALRGAYEIDWREYDRERGQLWERA